MLALFRAGSSWSSVRVFSLYFDGGCKPNPGQGYGSYEIVTDRSLYQSKNTLIQFGFMTNNMAEYHAMLHGIKKLWHDSKHGNVIGLDGMGLPPSQINLSIYSDSQILVKQLNGVYGCRVAHLRELIDEARLLLKEFGHWKAVWQRRSHNVARFGH